MASTRSILLVLLIALGALTTQSTGCAAVVGDSCEEQTDCGQQMFCELSLPGGYCTLRDCEPGGCTEEGVCIRFDEDTSFCMKACENNGDCRGSYRCVQDFGAHPFCNDEDGEASTDG